MAPAYERGQVPIARTVLKSPVGPLGLVSRDGRLAAIMFLPQPKMLPYLVERTYGNAGEEASAPFAQTIEQLEEYFAGRRLVFRLPLDLDQGTPFQRRVWKALLDIPYGATVTYKDIATSIGQPSAVRAVGSANGSNPIPIIVPCHRVVATGGRSGATAGASRSRPSCSTWKPARGCWPRASGSARRECGLAVRIDRDRQRSR